MLTSGSPPSAASRPHGLYTRSCLPQKRFPAMGKRSHVKPPQSHVLLGVYPSSVRHHARTRLFTRLRPGRGRLSAAMREGGGMRRRRRSVGGPAGFSFACDQSIISPFQTIAFVFFFVFFWPVLVIYSSESKLTPPCF